ncbi:MAG: C4-dicarboxylate ABC transporter, partial [Betaproteobacteria bacterium]
MDISLVAIMSIVALLIVVIISCIDDDLNVGFLAIGFAIIVAGVWGGTSGAKVMGYFPTSLFMILVGVTFMFGMAQTNGT